MSTEPLAVLMLVLGAVALSWLLTALVRRFAIRTSMLDQPNERSSHTTPTPRGGGVAIVVTCMGFAISLFQLGSIELRLLVATLGASGVVAVLGYLDDRSSMPARWRFLGHMCAAAWVVYWLDFLPHVPVFGTVVHLHFMGPLIAGVYIVWMINLFNFMDGIDGIASVEAITTAVGGAVLWWLVGSGTGWMLALVFAACVGGFLVWNWPPAKIFMGDAGSGFLGLMVALFSLWCGQSTPHLFWAWFILIGCFMVDATTTLIRRVIRGEKFSEAHRCHAYQYASRVHGSHKKVTLVCGAINVLWLLPLASIVALRMMDGVVGVIVAYTPLVWLAFKYKAGDRAAQAN
jgi:Fuc2NAc and GlcNAc transferase